MPQTTVGVLLVSTVLGLVGLAGMVLSFLAMASTDARDITAGTAGFTAGAIFIGTSLIAASIAVSRPSPKSG